MPALDEIFFVIKGVKVFPFKRTKENKTERNVEIERIEMKFMKQRDREVKANNPDLLIWLSLQDGDLV